MPRNLTSIWAMVIGATFFWGSNFNAASQLAGQLPPLTAAAARFAIAVAILLLMRALAGRAESHLDPRQLLALVLLGLIGVFGFNFAFFTALHCTSALNGALVMAWSPLLTTLLSAALLGTAITRQQLAGIAIAFAGVALVITGGHFADMHIARGDLWMILACVLWSLYSVLVRRFVADVPPLQQARWTISAGAAALISIAFWQEQPLLQIVRQPLPVYLILSWMAVCGTVLAYLFWLRGLQVLGPQRAAIAFNLVPVFTLLVNLVLGQWPQPAQYAGLLLVISGVLVASGVIAALVQTKTPVVTANVCVEANVSGNTNACSNG